MIFHSKQKKSRLHEKIPKKGKILTNNGFEEFLGFFKSAAAAEFARRRPNHLDGQPINLFAATAAVSPAAAAAAAAPNKVTKAAAAAAAAGATAIGATIKI